MTEQQTDIAAEMALAEAVAWLTTLQDSGRTPASEAAFQQWLLEDPIHKRAFAQATDVWDVLPGAVMFKEANNDQEPVRPRFWRPGYAMAACVALVAIGTGTWNGYLRDPVYETRVGEQQALALEDGTRVALNTNSEMSVDYSASERRVRLDRGEVLFNVAKNPLRPFIVEAGNELVRAIGTSFIVRRDGAKVQVTLLEGRVEVTRRNISASVAKAPAVLIPGQRLTTTPTAVAMDQPKIEAVTAWRQGNVVLEDQTLSAAVAEMSRYGEVHVQFADPALGNLRISGVFETQNPAQFAELAAEIHDLRVVRTGATIELRRRQ